MKTVGYALALAMLAAPAAQAAESWYLGAAGGWNHVNDVDIKPGDEIGIGSGVAGRVIAGLPVGNGFRVEGEGGYSWMDGVETSKISIANLHANLMYDVPTGWIINPYIGLGAGMSRVHMDSITTTDIAKMDDVDYVPSYAVMVGLSGQATESLTIFGGYRYFNTLEADFKVDQGTARVSTGTTVKTHDLQSHIFEIGLRYGF